MRSIGLDLELWQRKKLLQIHAARPTVFGLEMHLVAVHKAIEEFGPKAVIVDPISSFVSAGNRHDVKSMLVRLFDYLKTRAITGLVTSLSSGPGLDGTDIGVSSLIDTWIQVRDIEIAAERTRALYLVKSRGMGHSNQVREFVITSRGIEVLPITVGASGVLTGSARANEAERKQRQLDRKRRAMDAQIEAMRMQLAAEEEESQAMSDEIRQREQRSADPRSNTSLSRSRSRTTNGKRS
jgi:circadian clock protein KaiC